MTDVPIREYAERLVSDLDKRVDRRFCDLDTRYREHFLLNDVALTKAEAAASAGRTAVISGVISVLVSLLVVLLSHVLK